MKTKRIIAAVFAFAIAAANFSVTAFAAEEEIQTDVSTEAISTETTVETTATDVTETTTETVEDENTDEDTTIIEDVIEPSLISGETFTIGDESFTASIEDYKLKIYNDRGLAFEKNISHFSMIESIALRVDGNTLNIKEYDDSSRLIYDYNVKYNSSTGKFGDINNDGSESYSFNFQGVSFYANITRKMIGDDQYNYLSIYFAGGNPTSIQNEVVWIEYDRTGGFAGYGPATYINFSGDKLTISRIIDPYDSSKDILTTYVLDKETNNLVKSGSTSDTQEVTEQMLIDKFVAEYGEEPYQKDFGDFNGDGELDAYFYFPWKQHTYFVTMNNIIEVTKDHDIPGADNGPTFSYFELNDGTKFRFTSRTSCIYAGVHSWIYIDKINKDGTLSTASINGQESVGAVSCSVPFGNTEFCKSIDTSNIDTYLTVTETGITLKYYDGDKESITSTNYTYDAANNAFVVAGSTNNSGNSSNGSTSSISSSPATSDNFSVIPFTLSIALVAGSAAVVGVKNRRKK